MFKKKIIYNLFLFLFLFFISIYTKAEVLKNENYYDNNERYYRKWLGTYNKNKRRKLSYLARYYNNNKENTITGLNSSKLLLAKPKPSSEY